jgi:hypothetical protein
MAKLSLNIDTRCEQNGMVPVRLRINHKSTSAFVPTGVKVEPQYFISGSLYDPIHRKAYMASEKREQITRLVKRFEDYLLDVDRAELALLTASDIRERVCGSNYAGGFADAAAVSMRSTNYAGGAADSAVGGNYASRMSGAGGTGRMSGGRQSAGSALHTVYTGDMSAFGSAGGQLVGWSNRNAQNGDFVAFFAEYGASRRTAKTQESYAYCAKTLRDYCNARGLLTLTFWDVNYGRLTDFARWLAANGKGDATRHMMESYVRAAYKDAQKRHIISRENDPYFDYSIAPVPQKDIDCLTAEQMAALMRLELSQPSMQMARDIALASFYLCGANPLDLYDMSEPKDGDAVFVRHKIDRHLKREIHIRIEPELAALIDRWQGSGRMFLFRQTYPNFDGFRHKIAHRLRELKEPLGFAVSMPIIRRTWATIAGELECPENVINHSMGHVVGTVNARFYERYDWGLTAKWNRRIIDYIISQK